MFDYLSVMPVSHSLCFRPLFATEKERERKRERERERERERGRGSCRVLAAFRSRCVIITCYYSAAPRGRGTLNGFYFVIVPRLCFSSPCISIFLLSEKGGRGGAGGGRRGTPCCVLHGVRNFYSSLSSLPECFLRG